jgi:hypothetical protein
VEILGNDAVLADVLRIVSGAADAGADANAQQGDGRGEEGREGGGGGTPREPLGDRHVSAIREVAAAIDWGAG